MENPYRRDPMAEARNPSLRVDEALGLGLPWVLGVGIGWVWEGGGAGVRV